MNAHQLIKAADIATASFCLRNLRQAFDEVYGHCKQQGLSSGDFQDELESVLGLAFVAVQRLFELRAKRANLKKHELLADTAFPQLGTTSLTVAEAINHLANGFKHGPPLEHKRTKDGLRELGLDPINGATTWCLDAARRYWPDLAGLFSHAKFVGGSTGAATVAADFRGLEDIVKATP